MEAVAPLRRLPWPSLIALALVVSVAGLARARDTELSWIPPSDSDVAGYVIYYGGTSQSYDGALDVGFQAPGAGGVVTAVVDNLPDTDLYLAVTAYDTSGNESVFSNEILLSALTCDPACDDGNACTLDSCDASGCVNLVVSSGIACDDGNPNTVNDACLAGVCQGMTPQCLSDSDCDDADACNGVETCTQNLCMPGAPLTCGAAGPCQVGVCDAQLGCVVDPAPNGTLCNDGDPGTFNDICSAGVCSGEAPSSEPPSNGIEDGIGVYRDADQRWLVRATPTSGPAEASFTYGGAAGLLPVHGDWDGDGISTVGAFDPVTATWFLRDDPTPGPAERTFSYGPSGAQPVVGDWDGDGRDGLGVFDPAARVWCLRNAPGPGAADACFAYGPAGSRPVAGDWDGDGTTGIGVFDPGGAIWCLRNSPTPGPAATCFSYGSASDQPLAGDWNGDGRDGIGVYASATGSFMLREGASAGRPDHNVSITNVSGGRAVALRGTGPDSQSPQPPQVLPPGAVGIGVHDAASGEWWLAATAGGPLSASFTALAGTGSIPLFGDWDGDGVATPGTFDPATATWSLRDEPTPGPAERSFRYGPSGSRPIVADWNGDGIDGIGVFDPAAAVWCLRESASAGPAHVCFGYGPRGARPVVGDWDGDGLPGIGVFDPSVAVWCLRNAVGKGPADACFRYGSGAHDPVAGDWDGDGADGIGTYDPGSGVWRLRDGASPGAPDRVVDVDGLSGGRPVVWQP